MDSRQAEFRQQVAALGFDDIRFAALQPPLNDPLRAWLAAGHQADLHWMERTADKRLDPALVLPGAKSIVMLGVSYWRAPEGTPPPGTPLWARYALHEDYHDTIKPALVAAGRTLENLYGVSASDYRYYVDTGPVLERSWAARAGVGFTGKNAMLISRRHGNWLLLAALITRVDFSADAPIKLSGRHEPVGLLCGKCTRCLDACPTAAFTSPGVLDARRCISYHTIENKGIIPRALRPGIGLHLFGCDVCLEVCPWNRFAQAGRQLLLVARHDLASISLTEILSLTPERFAAVFRRTPIKRLKLAGLLRNACVVAGNTGDPAYRSPVVALATSHPSAIVRAHAVWAAYRLGAEAALASAQACESDPAVLAEYAAG